MLPKELRGSIDQIMEPRVEDGTIMRFNTNLFTDFVPEEVVVRVVVPQLDRVNEVRQTVERALKPLPMHIDVSVDLP
jgi:hypothetical protein